MQVEVSFFTAGRNVTQMFAEIVGLDNKFHIFDVDISLILLSSVTIEVCMV